MPYMDINLSITPQEQGEYLVNIAGPCTDAMTLKPARGVLDAMSRIKKLLEVEFRQWSLDRPMPEESLQGVGKDLFASFFGAESDDDPPRNNLWGLVEENLAAIKNNFPGHEARLRLQFDPASELAVQPWEAIYAEGNFLARRHDLSLVRTLPDQGAEGPVYSDGQGPLNIMVIMSNPSDCARLNVEEEELRDCWHDLENVGRINLKFIKHRPGKSLYGLLTDHVNRIQDDVPYVVHIIAHGDYEDGEGLLWFESEGGVSQPVRATDLAAILNRIRGLRLVVLNACHGGARVASRPFSSIAEKLIAANIPAVVAMQFEVSNEAAVLFAETFYNSIASGLSIDESVSCARGTLVGVRGDFQGNSSMEWCTPVLFLSRRYTDVTLIPKQPDESLMRQAQEWFNRQEFEKALSAYRLILRQEGGVSQSIRQEAKRFQPIAAGHVHSTRIQNLNRRQKKNPPEFIIAECDRVLDDCKVPLVEQIRRDAEKQIKAELDRSFSQGKERVARRNWAQAGKAFAACAERANTILRCARGCESAREYLRPAEIAEDFCWLFNCAENYLAQNAWVEAGNAFRNITSLRLSAFPPLRDLKPLGKEAGQSLSYIDGRVAEEGEDWVKAIEAYQALPAELRDVGARRAYAQGRLKEAEGDWGEALTHYRQLDARYHDLGLRRLYVEGRVAEEAEDWGAAAVAYESLSAADYLDASERLKYARGRGAEIEAEGAAAEDGEGWAKVVAGFGDLPDDYRGGDVGRRRRYAGGRLEVAQAMGRETCAEGWQAMMDVFDALPDDYLDVGKWRRYAQAMMDMAAGNWQAAAEKLRQLPDNFTHASEQQFYAAGRAAQDDGHWDAAVDAYQRVTQEWGDLRHRLSYARGRVAEQRDLWEEAAAAYGGCEADYEDVKHRRLYCAGRAAEARQDWQGVVDGFGELLNSHFGGEVGRRRSYARGRKAAEEGNWDGVIEGFKIEGVGKLPDQYRDGDVGRRRHYAEVRLAAERDDWQAVSRALRELPDEYRDGEVQSWRYYVQGRLAEEQEHWDETADAYAALPDEFRDAKDRAAYARARLAEQHEDWAGALSFFESLPDAYREGEVGRRKAYAVGRIAIQEGRWEDGEKSFASIPDFLHSPHFLLYARGRAAARRQEWEAALNALTEMAAKGGDGEAHKWLAYVRGRFLETQGCWREALEAYQPLLEAPEDATGRRFEDADQRRRRLGHLLQAAPWMNGLTRARLVRDPLCSWGGGFPYDALAAAGVSPDSPGSEVKNASFALMEKGLMTPEARVAWDQLRTVPKRLKVDALMYRLRGTQEIREFQQRVEPVSKSEVLRQACQAALEDSPLLMLLSGRREEAVAAWDEHLRQNPQNAAVAHALALAFFNRARELEDGGAYGPAEACWERAIANWAVLLTDDAYWRSWQQERAACYKEVVSTSDIATLRSELGEYVAAALSQYADRYQVKGQRERAAKFRQLALDFEVELEGARALKELGGLRLTGDHEAPLCCGLFLVRQLSLEQALSRLVLDLEQRLEREAAEADDVVAALEEALQQEEEQYQPVVAPQTLSRLRSTFSELGKATMLLERQRYEEVLEALPADYHLRKVLELPADCDPAARAEPDHLAGCECCQKFARLNPAYFCLPHRTVRLFRDSGELAVRSYLAAAEVALRSGRGSAGEAPDRKFTESVKCWEQAVAISRNVGTQVRTKQAIARVALGRATALEKERGQHRGQRLTEAIELLEAVRRLVGGVDEAQLRGKQSELLTDRGVWFGYGCHQWEEPDYELAARDLRKALELNPSSLHARDNMARALIFHASNLHLEGQHRRSLELLAESLALIDEGLRQFGNSTRLQGVLRRALQALEDVVRGSQSIDVTLRQLDEVISNPSLSQDTAAPDTQGIVGLAKRKLAEGDTPFAVLELIRAVDLDTGDESPRRELLAALRYSIEESSKGESGDDKRPFG